MKKRLLSLFVLMADGTFVSSGCFRQLLTIMCDIKNDVGTVRKTLVYACYTMSKTKVCYRAAFKIIYNHLCEQLGITFNQIHLQCDAEVSMFLGIEEILAVYNCQVITTICMVHVCRSNWFNLKKYLAVRTAPSEARLVLYFLQVLVSV